MASRNEEVPGSRRGELQALACNRSYVALWVGQTVSWIGNAFHRISLLFLLMEGVPRASQHVPLLLLMLVHAAAHLAIGPFAGVVVDRWSRKAAMIAADLARAGLVLLIPFAAGLAGHFWLYALSFLVTVASLFFEPARHSALPQVVGEKEIFLANSILATSESVAELVGLVAGGLFISRLGYRAAFFFDAFSFLISALAVALMTFQVAPVRQAAAWREELGQVLGDLRQGFAYVRRRVDIRALFGLFFLLAMAVGSVNYLLATFTKAGLGLGPEAYAVIDAGIVAGYVLGSVAVAAAGSGWNRIAMLGLGLFGMGAGNVVIAQSHHLPLAVAGGVIGGLFNPVYYVASRTYMQETVANEVLGRVFSLQFLVVQLGFVASVLLASVCLPWLGLRAWLFWSGAGLALVGILAPQTGVLGRLRRGEAVVSSRA
ncbi:MAG TPA: MFS transporter, partial [Firmicutes bacterium]|nr:MFS transporter [Bacillota bacterium]